MSVKLTLFSDASPWLHEAVSQIMATFSGEDTSFVPLANLLIELDRRSRAGDDDATKVLACVRQFSRLIAVAKRKL
jgi:hypothetical protein